MIFGVLMGCYCEVFFPVSFNYYPKLCLNLFANFLYIFRILFGTQNIYQKIADSESEH